MTSRTTELAYSPGSRDGRSVADTAVRRSELMDLEFNQAVRPHVPGSPRRADGIGAEAAAERALLGLVDAALCTALPVGSHGARERARLRSDLGNLCAAARGQGLRVETLIILLKARWRKLPEVHSFARRSRDGAEDALSRAITACIEEYFARRP